MSLTRRAILVSAGTIAIAAAVFTGALTGHTPTPTPANTASAKPTHASPSAPARATYEAPSAAQVEALPEARYNAVISGLLPYRETTIPHVADTVYRLQQDAPLYSTAKGRPVARLAAKNFLGQNTTVIPVRIDGLWTLVLTPSRQTLPSQDPTAPAQTAAWIRSSLLTKVQTTASRIVVSVGAQTVSIVTMEGQVVKQFPAAVGANGTPTPTGATGYLEARYLDPKQNQTVYPIGLTSLHSAAADEPFGGTDGGLIGIHYEPNNTGAISHGCVRLNAEAITAINQLPLGTLISMQR
jgi:lipoprotein-anchoring transpeptidase ErfK/SrfK